MTPMGKSILLVDDDQDIRELLEAYLSRAGFSVRAVADGYGFRTALKAEPADLLILDVMLPGEDGFSLCRWVRALSGSISQVPIIMLTASSDEADRVIGLELGADDYIGNHSARGNYRRGSKRFSGAQVLVTPSRDTHWCLMNGVLILSRTGCSTRTEKRSFCPALISLCSNCF